MGNATGETAAGTGQREGNPARKPPEPDTTGTGQTPSTGRGEGEPSLGSAGAAGTEAESRTAAGIRTEARAGPHAHTPQATGLDYFLAERLSSPRCAMGSPGHSGNGPRECLKCPLLMQNP